MKLIKSVPKRGADGGNIYTDEVLMISDDSETLRKKAHELCEGMNNQPEPWCSRYPLMGSAQVQPDHEWIMRLTNGTCFIIAK